MSKLPDGLTSRAVLIGVHTYHSLEDLPAVRQNLTGLREVFTDQRLWGLPADHCAVLDQPGSIRAVLDQVRDSARQATDTLVVYFAGHGSPDVATGELCLALPDSDPEFAYTMLPFDHIRRLVLDPAVRARRKVVILDCCYSARALPGWMDTQRVADQTEVEGSCVLTASAETRKALSPAGETYTAFTGELIATLAGGVPDGPDLLDMETVYRQVRRALETKARPVPQQRNRNAGGAIALVRNAAARPAVADRSLARAYAGMADLATTIGGTLGPHAGQVTVTGADGRPVTTGDPAVVCGSGTGPIQTLVRRMRTEWSDGAATAVVLAAAMMAEAVDVVGWGANPRRLAVELAALASTVRDELARHTIELETKEQVEAVVFTATADRTTARLLATALDKVGRGGRVRIEEDAPGRDRLVVPDGMFLPGPHWNGDVPRKASTRVWLTHDPLPAEQVPERLHPVIVLWPDAGRSAIVASGTAHPSPVVLPAPEPMAVLEDIAVLTGATLGQPRVIEVNAALGVQVALSTEGLLLGIGPGVSSDDVMARVHELRRGIRSAESAQEREALEMRLARLSSGEAYVFVGRRPGETDREFVARRQAVVRARDVLRLLTAHGLLPGGVLALRAAAQVLDSAPDGAGKFVLLRGLAAPATALLVNHGWAETDLPTEPGMGIDVATGRRGPMADLGILDAASVVLGALDAAVTTTREFLTQSHNEPVRAPERPQQTVQRPPQQLVKRAPSPQPREPRQGPKPELTIGTIGHHAHGKSTLAAAISKVLHDKYPKPNQSKPNEADTVSIGHIEYQTENRRYAHVEFPTSADLVKNTVIGAVRLDGAILVVAATDGPMPQTREQVLLARQVGVPSIVVALNKCDVVTDDEELLELIELEIRDVLIGNDYPGDDVPVIRVSALAALTGDRYWIGQIERLMAAVDECVPEPVRAIDKPFLMPIEDIFTITGRGTVVTGKVERGVLNKGDTVEIVGLPSTTRGTAAGIEKFRKVLERGEAGDNVGVLLHGVAKEDLVRGQVLAAPGTVSAHTRLEAWVYLLSEEEGGRSDPLADHNRLQFYFRTSDVTGAVTVHDGVRPGEHATVTVDLVRPIAMEEGQHFAIREAGKAIGAGRVSRVVR